MKKIRKVFVAGPANAARHSMVRRLKANGLLDEQIDTWEQDELDICDQAALRSYLRKSVPDQIYITAGPWDNPGDSQHCRGSYMADAMLGPIQVIHEALYAGVKKLLFVASHQVYSGCPVLPFAEEDLAQARVDQFRYPLALAHTAGIHLCEAYTEQFGEVIGVDYRSVVVGNLYGPGDKWHPSSAGEMQALMRHIHQAKLFKLSTVNIRSNGLRRSDWLYVDDMAEACIKVLAMPNRLYGALTGPHRSLLNVGSGRACSTMELAQAIASTVGYQGEMRLESALDDNTEDMLLDAQRMRSAGWEPQVGLETGLAHLYRDYREQQRKLAAA